MTLAQLIFLAGVFVLVMSAVLGAVMMLRPSAAQQRLRTLDHAPEPAAASAGQRWLRWVADMTRPVSRLAAPEEGFEKSNLKLRFSHAGMRNPNAPAAFFGIKTVLTIGLPIVAYAGMVLSASMPKGNNLLFVLLIVATLGYYAPNVILARMVRTRQREIFEAFPDALDLMTVCVEAGLGTEAALSRVAEDMGLKSPALAEEFRLVNLELRAGADRERALRNLAIRTGVEEVGAFVTMVSQAERFGTSIAASLRVHSDMLRTRRRQRAEEAAAKISLKLLFPLIFCIFPSLLVVLMGPAVIQVSRILLPTMGGQP
ncbi:type II secretion system F family protein [Piscinibacter sp. XHJ-5]|uniref:type II secretion system F family protein n=1 Tax=Piscinibacter sp. XHJ-5 TaxID=3037797 RepID=UPI0024535BF1|nr:type II secretion system F family protein [Piscinibacter sp. XHJ-5]